MPRQYIRTSPLLRTLRRVIYDGDCWIFDGALRKGYGSIKVDGKVRYTHQVVYEALIGPLPGGEPDHLCKRTACCNPWHLRYGSHQDNMRTIHGDLERCKRGHLRVDHHDAKRRICRECENYLQRERRARRSRLAEEVSRESDAPVV